MNIILLIFFAIPLAVVIFSIALQKILKCPALVAGIIFAIGIIVTFIVSDLIFLEAVLIYTLISYITAVITCLICRYFNCDDRNDCRRRNCCCNNTNNRENELLTISSNCRNNRNGDLLTINSTCANGNTNNLLTIRSGNNGNCDNDRDNCGCGNDNDFNQANTINGVIRIVDNNNCNNNCSCNNDEISTRINVVPNSANNGRTGCICGRYRRR